MPRGDGRLTHDLLPGEKAPQDACGVFGVWAPGEDVAKLTYYGLYALQHRGQESAGIATSDGQRLLVYKDMGLVSQVFDERSLASLRGHLAVGHCRYSTTGGSTWENAQPTLGGHAGGTVALAHNGNLTNSAELRDLVEGRLGDEAHRGELARGNTTDTALVTALLADDADRTLEAAALDVLPRLRGAFCFVFIDEHTLYAARDPHGIRPLVIGRLERGWVVASETAALDIVGASLRARGRARRARRHRRGGPALTALRRADAEGLRVRVRLPGPARHDDQWPGRPRGPGGDGTGARQGAPGRRRPRHADPGVGHAGRHRVRPGVRDPLWPGTGEELLRRTHLHRPVADDPPARHPAQAQPPQGRHPRQAPRRRRRLDRPRQHAACARADAAGGGRRGGPRADLVAARALALLLRHRLRDPRRAHRDRTRGRGGAQLHRCGLAGLHLRRRDDRGDPAAAGPALHRLLHRLVPGAPAGGRPVRQGGARAGAADHSGGPERPTGPRHPQRHAPLVDVPVLDVDLPLDIDGVPTSVAGGAAEAVLRP